MIHVKKTNKIFQTKKNNGSPKTYSGDTFLIYINLMIIDAENCLIYLFIICRSSLEKCLFTF